MDDSDCYGFSCVEGVCRDVPGGAGGGMGGGTGGGQGAADGGNSQVPKAAFTSLPLIVVDDTNQDGKLSPGERGRLRVILVNSGNAAAMGVKGTLTTTSGGVTLANATDMFFGDMATGAQSCADDPTCSSTTLGPEVTLSGSLPVGQVIYFKLSLTDSAQNRYTVSFVYEAVSSSATRVAPGALTLLTDTDGDGKLKPGESGRLRLEVLNSGTLTALGLSGTLTTTTTGVTLSSAADLSLGDLAPGARACVEDPTCTSTTVGPEVTVATDAAPGTVINLQLVLTDSLQNVYAVPFSYKVDGIGFSPAGLTLLTETDGDGRLSPGESGRLRVRVSNTGTMPATGVTGTLTTTTPGVTLTYATDMVFGNISAGALSCADDSTCGSTTVGPVLTVSSAVPVGTVINFQLVLTDSLQNSYTVTYSYSSVMSPLRGFSPVSLTLLSETNGDGKLSPGESGSLRVKVSNSGTIKAFAVRGTLTTTTPGVTLTYATNLSFGDMVPGAQACAAEPSCNNAGAGPYIAVSSTVPLGTVIDFQLALTDSLQNTYSVPFSYTVQ
ncbi:MAG: hypothetical protein RL653_4152 [Pseudomonadota bacterium]